MPPPTTRTGFKQASNALRKHGLRAARTERTALHGTSEWKFLAVPLKRGLRDDCLTASDVAFGADSLSDLVAVVEAGAKGGSARDYGASGATGSSADKGDRYSADNEADAGSEEWQRKHGFASEAESTTTSAEEPIRCSHGFLPSEGCTQCMKDGAKSAGMAEVTPEALNALRLLLGGGTDEKRVRDILNSEVGERIDSAARQIAEKLDAEFADAKQAVEKQTADALHSIQNMIPLPVVIKREGHEDVKVEGQHREFATLVRLFGLRQNVYAVGPAGSGKTTAMVKAAEALGRKAYVLSSIQDTFQATGFVDAGGRFVETPVYRWAKDPGSLLIIDEIDRADPNALCSLHSMIENGLAVFACGEVKVPAENLVCATANTFGVGPDAEYVGSNRLDAATLNRFPVRLTWDYDEALETRIGLAHGADASEISFGQRVRREIRKLGLKVVWSPRDVVAHAVRVSEGFSREESLRLSSLACLENGQRQNILEAAR